MSYVSRAQRNRDNGIRLLGVDSVTDISGNVVGRVSGERMSEEPGKGGGTDLTEVTGNSENMMATRCLATRRRPWPANHNPPFGVATKVKLARKSDVPHG